MNSSTAWISASSTAPVQTATTGTGRSCVPYAWQVQDPSSSTAVSSTWVHLAGAGQREQALITGFPGWDSAGSVKAGQVVAQTQQPAASHTIVSPASTMNGRFGAAVCSLGSNATSGAAWTMIGEPGAGAGVAWMVPYAASGGVITAGTPQPFISASIAASHGVAATLAAIGAGCADHVPLSGARWAAALLAAGTESSVEDAVLLIQYEMRATPSVVAVHVLERGSAGMPTPWLGASKWAASGRGLPSGILSIVGGGLQAAVTGNLSAAVRVDLALPYRGCVLHAHLALDNVTMTVTRTESTCLAAALDAAPAYPALQAPALRALDAVKYTAPWPVQARRLRVALSQQQQQPGADAVVMDLLVSTAAIQWNTCAAAAALIQFAAAGTSPAPSSTPGLLQLHAAGAVVASVGLASADSAASARGLPSTTLVQARALAGQPSTLIARAWQAGQAAAATSWQTSSALSQLLRSGASTALPGWCSAGPFAQHFMDCSLAVANASANSLALVRVRAVQQPHSITHAQLTALDLQASLGAVLTAGGQGSFVPVSACELASRQLPGEPALLFLGMCSANSGAGAVLAAALSPDTGVVNAVHVLLQGVTLGGSGALAAGEHAGAALATTSTQLLVGAPGPVLTHDVCTQPGTGSGTGQPGRVVVLSYNASALTSASPGSVLTAATGQQFEQELACSGSLDAIAGYDGVRCGTHLATAALSANSSLLVVSAPAAAPAGGLWVWRQSAGQPWTLLAQLPSTQPGMASWGASMPAPVLTQPGTCVSNLVPHNHEQAQLILQSSAGSARQLIACTVSAVDGAMPACSWARGDELLLAGQGMGRSDPAASLLAVTGSGLCFIRSAAQNPAELAATLGAVADAGGQSGVLGVRQCLPAPMPSATSAAPQAHAASAANTATTQHIAASAPCSVASVAMDPAGWAWAGVHEQCAQVSVGVALNTSSSITWTLAALLSAAGQAAELASVDTLGASASFLPGMSTTGSALLLGLPSAQWAVPGSSGALALLHIVPGRSGADELQLVHAVFLRAAADSTSGLGSALAPAPASAGAPGLVAVGAAQGSAYLLAIHVNATVQSAGAAATSSWHADCPGCAWASTVDVSIAMEQNISAQLPGFCGVHGLAWACEQESGCAALTEWLLLGTQCGSASPTVASALLDGLGAASLLGTQDLAQQVEPGAWQGAWLTVGAGSWQLFQLGDSVAVAAHAVSMAALLGSGQPAVAAAAQASLAQTAVPASVQLAMSGGCMALLRPGTQAGHAGTTCSSQLSGSASPALGGQALVRGGFVSILATNAADGSSLQLAWPGKRTMPVHRMPGSIIAQPTAGRVRTASASSSTLEELGMPASSAALACAGAPQAMSSAGAIVCGVQTAAGPAWTWRSTITLSALQAAGAAGLDVPGSQQPVAASPSAWLLRGHTGLPWAHSAALGASVSIAGWLELGGQPAAVVVAGCPLCQVQAASGRSGALFISTVDLVSGSLLGASLFCPANTSGMDWAGVGAVAVPWSTSTQSLSVLAGAPGIAAGAGAFLEIEIAAGGVAMLTAWRDGSTLDASVVAAPVAAARVQSMARTVAFVAHAAAWVPGSSGVQGDTWSSVPSWTARVGLLTADPAGSLHSAVVSWLNAATMQAALPGHVQGPAAIALPCDVVGEYSVDGQGLALPLYFPEAAQRQVAPAQSGLAAWVNLGMQHNGTASTPPLPVQQLWMQGNGSLPVLCGASPFALEVENVSALSVRLVTRAWDWDGVWPVRPAAATLTRGHVPAPTPTATASAASTAAPTAVSSPAASAVTTASFTPAQGAPSPAATAAASAAPSAGATPGGTPGPAATPSNLATQTPTPTPASSAQATFTPLASSSPGTGGSSGGVTMFEVLPAGLYGVDPLSVSLGGAARRATLQVRSKGAVGSSWAAQVTYLGAISAGPKLPLLLACEQGDTASCESAAGAGVTSATQAVHRLVQLQPEQPGISAQPRVSLSDSTGAISLVTTAQSVHANVLPPAVARASVHAHLVTFRTSDNQWTESRVIATFVLAGAVAVQPAQQRFRFRPEANDTVQFQLRVSGQGTTATTFLVDASATCWLSIVGATADVGMLQLSHVVNGSRVPVPAQPFALPQLYVLVQPGQTARVLLSASPSLMAPSGVTSSRVEVQALDGSEVLVPETNATVFSMQPQVEAYATTSIACPRAISQTAIAEGDSVQYWPRTAAIAALPQQFSAYVRALSAGPSGVLVSAGSFQLQNVGNAPIELADWHVVYGAAAQADVLPAQAQCAAGGSGSTLLSRFNALRAAAHQCLRAGAPPLPYGCLSPRLVPAGTGWFAIAAQAAGLRALPGDSITVPFAILATSHGLPDPAAPTTGRAVLLLRVLGALNTYEAMEIPLEAAIGPGPMRLARDVAATSNAVGTRYIMFSDRLVNLLDPLHGERPGTFRVAQRLPKAVVGNVTKESGFYQHWYGPLAGTWMMREMHLSPDMLLARLVGYVVVEDVLGNARPGGLDAVRVITDQGEAHPSVAALLVPLARIPELGIMQLMSAAQYSNLTAVASDGGSVWVLMANITQSTSWATYYRPQIKDPLSGAWLNLTEAMPRYTIPRYTCRSWHTVLAGEASPYVEMDGSCACAAGTGIDVAATLSKALWHFSATSNRLKVDISTLFIPDLAVMCTVCDQGKYNPEATRLTATHACKHCADGTFSTLGSDSCHPCPYISGSCRRGNLLIAPGYVMSPEYSTALPGGDALARVSSVRSTETLYGALTDLEFGRWITSGDFRSRGMLQCGNPFACAVTATAIDVSSTQAASSELGGAAEAVALEALGIASTLCSGMNTEPALLCSACEPEAAVLPNVYGARGQCVPCQADGTSFVVVCLSIGMAAGLAWLAAINWSAATGVGPFSAAVWMRHDGIKVNRTRQQPASMKLRAVTRSKSIAQGGTESMYSAYLPLLTAPLPIPLVAHFQPGEHVVAEQDLSLSARVCRRVKRALCGQQVDAGRAHANVQAPPLELTPWRRQHAQLLRSFAAWHLLLYLAVHASLMNLHVGITYSPNKAFDAPTSTGWRTASSWIATHTLSHMAFIVPIGSHSMTCLFRSTTRLEADAMSPARDVVLAGDGYGRIAWVIVFPLLSLLMAITVFLLCIFMRGLWDVLDKKVFAGTAVAIRSASVSGVGLRRQRVGSIAAASDSLSAAGARGVQGESAKERCAARGRRCAAVSREYSAFCLTSSVRTAKYYWPRAGLPWAVGLVLLSTVQAVAWCLSLLPATDVNSDGGVAPLIGIRMNSTTPPITPAATPVGGHVMLALLAVIVCAGLVLAPLYALRKLTRKLGELWRPVVSDKLQHGDVDSLKPDEATSGALSAAAHGLQHFPPLLFPNVFARCLRFRYLQWLRSSVADSDPDSTAWWSTGWRSAGFVWGFYRPSRLWFVAAWWLYPVIVAAVYGMIPNVWSGQLLQIILAVAFFTGVEWASPCNVGLDLYDRKLNPDGFEMVGAALSPAWDTPAFLADARLWRSDQGAIVLWHTGMVRTWFLRAMQFSFLTQVFSAYSSFAWRALAQTKSSPDPDKQEVGFTLEQLEQAITVLRSMADIAFWLVLAGFIIAMLPYKPRRLVVRNACKYVSLCKRGSAVGGKACITCARCARLPEASVFVRLCRHEYDDVVFDPVFFQQVVADGAADEAEAAAGSAAAIAAVQDVQLPDMGGESSQAHMLDEHGGYYDEYGGYYDADGGYFDTHGGYFDAAGTYYPAAPDVIEEPGAHEPSDVYDDGYAEPEYGEEWAAGSPQVEEYAAACSSSQQYDEGYGVEEPSYDEAYEWGQPDEFMPELDEYGGYYDAYGGYYDAEGNYYPAE